MSAELKIQLPPPDTADAATLAQRLEDMRAAMVKMDKMANLGMLVAGIAHEINTPVSVVKGGVENALEALPQLLAQLPALARSLPEADYLLLVELCQQLTQPLPPLTSREERQYRRDTAQLLATHGAPDADILASRLVQAGLHTWAERLAPLVARPEGQQVLALLHNASQLRMNLRNAEMAADRTLTMVRALKNHAYNRQEDVMEPVDLAQNVATILQLYHNELKYGVEVERDLADGLMVLAYPDELGQIWTNLLHNALQAMQKTGAIKVVVRKADAPGLALVALTDNGPGIPEEVQPRIFDPFFTTKKQGEGTGLGLDIVRKIVATHGGSIWFDSQPGNTTFYVQLPLS